MNFNSVGHYVYPNTADGDALFNPPPKKKFPLAGEWPKLFRGNNVEKTRFVWWCTVQVHPVFAHKVANFPEGLLCPMPRRPLMVRAALMRRSCDGVAAATESLLQRSCADQLRRAHSARRVRDGADAAATAAATELMLRAALLRRSCDGVAAATEQRRTAPSRSFCASRLDATR